MYFGNRIADLVQIPDVPMARFFASGGVSASSPAGRLVADRTLGHEPRVPLPMTTLLSVAREKSITEPN
jgi:hypothetical protein